MRGIYCNVWHAMQGDTQALEHAHRTVQYLKRTLPLPMVKKFKPYIIGDDACKGLELRNESSVIGVDLL